MIKRKGQKANTGSTQQVGVDEQGRPVYSEGHRRADGVWVFPGPKYVASERRYGGGGPFAHHITDGNNRAGTGVSDD